MILAVLTLALFSVQQPEDNTTSRASYPMVTEYIYDTLDRVTDVRYPAEYGMANSPRKVAHHDYDVASRLSGLKVDGADYASAINYNAASQTTSLKVGASGSNQITENYSYNALTGLLENQTVVRGTTTTLLDLTYDYAGANGKRTGQLTRIINNRDNRKNRNYEYDAVGRLARATGGTPTLWTQTYMYDRWGNRTGVVETGTVAANMTAPVEPKVVLPSEVLARISTPELPEDVSHHAAGNKDDSSASHDRAIETKSEKIISSSSSSSKDVADKDGKRLERKEAAASFAPIQSSATNLALNKSATQSSTGYGGAVGRAVDGNTDGNWSNGTMTHTNDDTQAWWQVDLGGVQSIQNIKLWNRTDCCGERLSNFYVLVSDAPFTSTDLTATLNQSGVASYYTSGQAGVQTVITVNRSGRYVRVQLSGTNYLSLAEVEVWGSQSPLPIFFDDFNDNVRDTTKWTTGEPANGTVLEQNQRLEITPPATTTGYNGYLSTSRFDLTGRSASLEVVQSTASIYGIETHFYLYDSSANNYLLFAAGGGNFVLQSSVNGAVTRAIIGYDAAQHRYWRFRHDLAGDTIVWETSADGRVWRGWYTLARPFPITGMQIYLIAGKYTATTPTSTAILDNVRIDGNPWNAPPTVSITAPTNNASFAAGSNILIQTNAADSDGYIGKVEFFQGSTKIGESYGSPFSLAWSNVAAGNYSLTAKALDNSGAVTTSSAVNISVVNQNQPPVANAGGPYTASTGAVVSVDASASSDADGTITSYQWNFGDGTTGTGVTTTHVYAAAGTYTATLTVTDNNAAQASATASVSITNQMIPRDGLSSVSYDGTSNRITTAGYAYDAAGNQIRVVHADSSVQKYQYDAAGRIVKVRNANGVVLATYTYGASNQRLVSQDGDEQSSYRTYYAWGGDAVVAEYSESPSQPTSPQWTKSYVYLGARLLATLTPSGTSSEFIQYHHPDRLGTRLVTNAQDTNSFEQVSLPFGTALDAESSGATNRRFTSYDRSTVTGLDYAVNRHYDSQQGRFTSVDPIGAGASSLDDPQSWNLYAYVGNDPVNRIDPDGLFWGKIGRFFKNVGKAIVKVLSNKWVQLAIGIALIAVTLFLYSPVMFALTTGIETSSRVGIGIKILHGALAGGLLVGQVANALQERQDGDDIDPEDVIRIYTSAPRWSDGVAALLIASGRAIASALQAATKTALKYDKCFQANQFSSLFAGTRLHGVAQVVEVGSEFSFGGDLAAITAKSARVGFGGTKNTYASGLNFAIKRSAKLTGRIIGRRVAFGSLRVVGDVGSPILAGIGALSFGYNLSTAVQCGAGVVTGVGLLK